MHIRLCPKDLVFTACGKWRPCTGNTDRGQCYGRGAANAQGKGRGRTGGVGLCCLGLVKKAFAVRALLCRGEECGLGVCSAACVEKRRGGKRLLIE